ncbi:restriction endonuclease subunit S [Edwardsiella ictaluri]|nr:restriction endonuclease subunit S [Edwardsiella ictaluri]QPW31733.1 restriction endonuclease subunit S [Edwardsiella ictaluri]WJH22717.1 restriction endonuclease subunit S [Edwardsiella ictaluri]
MPKYDTYKNSGVEWIEQVPEGWGLVKIKNYADVFNGDSLNDKQKAKYESEDQSHRSYISSKDIDVNYSKINYQNGLRIPKGSSYKVCPSNSTLMCIEGGSAGKKIAYTNQEVCFVNKLACFLASKRIDSHFLYYYLSSVTFKSQFFNSMTGLIGGVSISAIKNFWLVLPSPTEQVAIASFLSKKLSQIDEAITTKEQQISLLKERKQILIQQAATQGLDPCVPMKDSGVDWIGKIPEHWQVIRFKNLFSQSRIPVRKEDGVVTSYRDGQVTLRSNRRLDGYTEAIIEGGYQGIRKGQLVLNSMDAFEGAIGVSESDGKCTPEYVICDPVRADVSQYYFAYLLREMALAKYIQVICNAVRQRAVRIRFNNLASRFMVLPPSDEQEKIVEFIESEKGKINKGVEHLKGQIEKLKEYKTTLINSAVTGKIKVV